MLAVYLAAPEVENDRRALNVFHGMRRAKKKVAGWQSLDGRKRNPNQKPKVRSLNDLPLRGFLKCSNCSRMLTGSASKGNGGYYYYYHCSAACKVRFKAQLANERLVHELRELIPKPGRIEIFTQAVMDDFKQKVKHQETERKQILSELDSISIRMQKARIMKVDGDLEESDFKMIKEQSASKTEELEKKLNSLQGRDRISPKSWGEVKKLVFLH